MRELLRTNDMVLFSYVEALLSEAHIVYIVSDQHMSVLEGSLGILPRRMLISDDDWEAAIKLLGDAGLDQEIGAPRDGLAPWIKVF